MKNRNERKDRKKGRKDRKMVREDNGRKVNTKTG